MTSKQPVAIVFDTFGTVVDWRSSLIADLTAYGATRGVTADWPALVDAWRAAYHPSMDRVRKGEQPWTKLDALHRASLDRLVDDFGIKGLSEDDLVHINLGWHRLRPWPDCGARPDPAEIALHHRPAVERQCLAAAEHGEIRRHSLGHDLRVRPVRAFQARSGDLSRVSRGCWTCDRIK